VPQHSWLQEILSRYDSDIGVMREDSPESSLVVQVISNDSMREEEEVLLK
jgi:hypothetical protein